jgi:hypothetical protein
MRTISVQKFLHLSESKRHNFTGVVLVPTINAQINTKRYYKKGSLHREDGPAVEFTDGHKEWWYEGNFIYMAGCAFYTPNIKEEERYMIHTGTELMDISIVETSVPEYPKPIKLRKVLSPDGILYIPILPGM